MEKTATINIKRLTMWEMTDEDDSEYGEAISFIKRVMAYTDSIETNSTDLNGDGEVVDIAIGTGKGTLKLDIHGLTSEERGVIYGEKIENGTNFTTGDEIVPNMCVAVMVAKNGKEVNLRKWFRVKFTPHEEKTSQIEKSNVTFSTITLNGTYTKDEKYGYRCVRLAVDTTTEEGKEIIEKWFTDATYTGPTSDEG